MVKNKADKKSSIKKKMKWLAKATIIAISSLTIGVTAGYGLLLFVIRTQPPLTIFDIIMSYVFAGASCMLFFFWTEKYL